jgi:hypothetical protein
MIDRRTHLAPRDGYRQLLLSRNPRMKHPKLRKSHRKGAVAVLAAVLAVPLLGISTTTMVLLKLTQ